MNWNFFKKQKPKREWHQLSDVNKILLDYGLSPIPEHNNANGRELYNPKLYIRTPEYRSKQSIRENLNWETNPKIPYLPPIRFNDDLKPLQTSEEYLFIAIWFPQFKYENFKLLTLEEYFEHVADVTLDHLLANYTEKDRLYRIIKKYEFKYIAAHRLNRRRPRKNFSYIVATKMFFHLYEANRSLSDNRLLDAYLKAREQ